MLVYPYEILIPKHTNDDSFKNNQTTFKIIDNNILNLILWFIICLVNNYGFEFYPQKINKIKRI